MKLRTWLTLAAASALLSLPTIAAADTTVKADLVELNGSGAGGTVVLTTTDDGGLKVSIHSKGLVPGQPHPQHIHGSAGGHHFMCPTVKDNDTDGDGVLTNEEASGEYGTIFMALTTRGGATPQDGLDVARMPVADKQGRLDYERTFSAKAVPDGLLENLGSLHVVQHGIDVNDNGTYDLDALGESTFAANLGELWCRPRSQRGRAGEPRSRDGRRSGRRTQRSPAGRGGGPAAAVGRSRRLRDRRTSTVEWPMT